MAKKTVAAQGKGRKKGKVTSNVRKGQNRAAPVKVVRKAAASGQQKKREKRDFKSTHAHLFEKRPRTFSTGGDLPPRKRDLSRVVKWPRYIRIQRQRAILKQRLKVPPPIHQFSETLDKNQATELYALMRKYRPETRAEKKKRLYDEAKKQAAGKMTDESGEKPRMLKFGLSHVTHLIEEKKAKLVVIAHDVDPIELVLWLPALCQRMDVPYCIVKGRARLGAVVHQKTAAVVAFTDVKKGADDATLTRLAENFYDRYNKQPHKNWGGGKLGVKTRARVEKLERIAAREEAQKLEAI